MDKQNKTPIWTKDFIGITIINLLIFFGFQMLLPTLPIYVKSLGGADAVIGWIIGLTTIASISVRPFSGMALDKFGRKGVLLLGIGILIVISLAYMWVPIVGVILALRFLHGLGWGAASTASSTVVTDVIPKTRFGEGIGFFSLSANFAMAIAPGVGLSILAALHITGLALFSAGVGAVALMISFFIRYRPVDTRNTVKNRRSPYERSSIRPSIIMFFVTASFGSITGFISLYAVEQGVANIGLFFLIYAATMVVSRPFFGRFIDRLGFNAAIYPGLIILVVAMFILSQATALPFFLIAGLLYGVGFGAAQSSLQTMAVVLAPADRFGAANATFYTGFDGGIGFGSIIGGMVASAWGYGCDVFIVIAFPHSRWYSVLLLMPKDRLKTGMKHRSIWEV